SIRYSGAAASRPRAAKYSAVAANCAGLPVAQLPPKKKTMTGRRSLDFQFGGKYRLIFRSPCGVVLYAATALLSTGRISDAMGFRGGDACPIIDCAVSTARRTRMIPFKTSSKE